MTPNEAKIIADFLLPQIEMEVQTTARVLSVVPDSCRDYTPAEKCMNAGTLATHLAAADVWFLEAVLKGAFAPFPAPSMAPMAELAEQYKKSAGEVLGKIKAMSGEDLAKNVQFHTFDMPNVTYLQIMQKHSVHHRGQLTAYLRPMGAKVPSIYGGSADEAAFTASASEGK